MVKSYGINAELYFGSMTNVPFETVSMDAIVDVFSSISLIYHYRFSKSFPSFFLIHSDK